MPISHACNSPPERAPPTHTPAPQPQPAFTPTVLRALFWLLVLPLIVVLGIAVTALDPTPLVVRDASISPASIAQARLLLKRHDPRRLRDGEEARAHLPVGLIDDAANHFASRLGGRAQVNLDGEALALRASLAVPGLVPARFINLRVTVGAGDGPPRLTSAALGSLPLPPVLAEFLLDAGLRIAGYGEAWPLARQTVRGVGIDSARRHVEVRYVWQAELLERARAIALDDAHVAQLEAAQRDLAALLAHRAPRQPVPLLAVLQPMLAAGDGERADPARRRAALAVLASYIAERSLAPLIPAARDWPRPRAHELTLLGRHDSAQHFVISAALAAWAGEPLADAIGVYKELADARHGSGFSFADLAADRAGARFGELLMREPARIDALLAAPLTDSALVPPLHGLPEFISAREFARRYLDTDSPAYRQLIDEVERRVGSLPLYRAD